MEIVPAVEQSALSNVAWLRRQDSYKPSNRRSPLGNRAAAGRICPALLHLVRMGFVPLKSIKENPPKAEACTRGENGEPHGHFCAERTRPGQQQEFRDIFSEGVPILQHRRFLLSQA